MRKAECATKTQRRTKARNRCWCAVVGCHMQAYSDDEKMRANNTFSCTITILACVGSGCVSYDFCQPSTDANVADLRPDRVCGEHGMIHTGLTRQEVQAIMAQLKLTPGQSNAHQTTYGIHGQQSEFWLISPEGGGTFHYPVWFNLSVEYDDNGLVSRCSAGKIRSD